MQKSLFGVTALTLAMMGDVTAAFAADCKLEPDAGVSEKAVIVKLDGAHHFRSRFQPEGSDKFGAWALVTSRQPDDTYFVRVARSGKLQVIGFDEDGAPVCDQAEGEYTVTSGGGAAKPKVKAPAPAAAAPSAAPAPAAIAPMSPVDFAISRLTRVNGGQTVVVGLPVWKRSDTMRECSGPDVNGDSVGDTCTTSVVEGVVPLVDVPYLDQRSAELRAEDVAQAKAHAEEEHGTWPAIREKLQTVGAVLGTVVLALLVL